MAHKSSICLGFFGDISTYDAEQKSVYKRKHE